MNDRPALLEQALSALKEAARCLTRARAHSGGLVWNEREPKAPIDQELNDVVLARLHSTGIAVLSEESDGAEWPSHDPMWIIDPLDGTFNFSRELGPCAVSICLWRGNSPDFGAILDVHTGDIAWGGGAYGAWRKVRLAVSQISRIENAALCTGFPSSFDFHSGSQLEDWKNLASRFGKVRMLGSAASSLLLVAQGSAECYYEDKIQIWDVAAGLALVEGAGGVGKLEADSGNTTVRLLASNRALANELLGSVSAIKSP